jgi:peptidyl-prolyl cis-trans isomerase SurA
VKFNRIIVLTIALVMLTCMSVRSEIIDRIIAVVNDEVITLKEVDAAFEPYLKKIEESLSGQDKEAAVKRTRDALLQRLIDNLLIAQEARKTGISVRDEEIMVVLEDSLVRQNTKMEDFLKKMAQEGNSLETVKNEIRQQLVRTRLMRREIKSKVMISDQEIGEYYNKHRDEYEGKEAVRIYQLLFVLPKDADRAAKTKIKDQAERIHKLATSGEPFDLLAVKYSQGPEAAQGGDIGFIEKGVTIPEVEKVAFSLPLNQVSDVIESDIGLHIIKVVDKRGAGIKPMVTVREEIKIKLEDEKLDKKYDEWISALRKKSYIEMR